MLLNAAVLIIAIVVAPRLLSFTVLSAPETMTDFPAFYCGARIAAAGGDPARAEPLRTCEHAHGAGGLYRFRELAVPDPLPPYAIALFEPLARLPYDVAAWIWKGVLAASFVVAVLALRRLTKLPWMALIASLAMIDGLVSFSLGQLVPVVVAALCVCAVAFEERRWGVAAAAGALTMIEPTIGLPACLALAWSPARRWVAGFGVVFAGLSLVTMPLATIVRYFSSVLPEHARSEVANFDQYSATWLLHALGASPTAALAFGTISYFALLVAGLAAAARIRAAGGRPAFTVLLPVAAAMLGGTFVHVTQIAAALPAALLACAVLAPHRRLAPIALVGLIATAVPWLLLGAGYANAGIAALSVLAVAGALYPSKFRLIAVGAGCALVGTSLLRNALAPDPRAAQIIERAIHTAASSTLSASASWTAFSTAQGGALSTAALLAAKAPTWIGLVIVLCCAWRASYAGCTSTVGNASPMTATALTPRRRRRGPNIPGTRQRTAIHANVPPTTINANGSNRSTDDTKTSGAAR
ncbi:MAG: hypothetical protein JWO85_3227 [Candidatus Eremiobacteraeota bacterium]|nr:hypothetical protein [Candidatus Eremiobacteraeota bacterium]